MFSSHVEEYLSEEVSRLLSSDLHRQIVWLLLRFLSALPNCCFCNLNVSSMEQKDFEMTESQSSIEFKAFVITDLQSRNISTECSRSCLASLMGVILSAAIVVVKINM